MQKLVSCGRLRQRPWRPSHPARARRAINGKSLECRGDLRKVLQRNRSAVERKRARPSTPAGVGHAPACIDCHGEHLILEPSNRLPSYDHSFHGLCVRKGKPSQPPIVPRATALTKFSARVNRAPRSTRRT